jgi:hypothetical protein
LHKNDEGKGNPTNAKMSVATGAKVYGGVAPIAVHKSAREFHTLLTLFGEIKICQTERSLSRQFILHTSQGCQMQQQESGLDDTVVRKEGIHRLFRFNV